MFSWETTYTEADDLHRKKINDICNGYPGQTVYGERVQWMNQWLAEHRYGIKASTAEQVCGNLTAVASGTMSIGEAHLNECLNFKDDAKVYFRDGDCKMGCASCAGTCLNAAAAATAAFQRRGPCSTHWKNFYDDFHPTGENSAWEEKTNQYQEERRESCQHNYNEVIGEHYDNEYWKENRSRLKYRRLYRPNGGCPIL